MDRPTTCNRLRRLGLFAAMPLGLGLGAWPVARAAADDAKLNVNPGLWEITTTATPGGDMTIPEQLLANVPPDKRAQAEAAMKAAMEHATKPHTFKECVTEQQIKDTLSAAQQQRPGCQATVVSSSRTLLEIQQKCTGQMSQMGTYRLAAPDPATMHGTLDMAMTEGGHTMTMKTEVNGKWLNADCGSVKPGRLMTP